MNEYPWNQIKSMFDWAEKSRDVKTSRQIMEIGGTDVCIAIPNANPEHIFNIIKTFWQNATKEKVSDELSEKNDLFIYKSEKDQKEWDNNGLTGANFDTMIYVMPREKELWLTVDYPISNETNDIIQAIKDNKFKKRT